VVTRDARGRLRLVWLTLQLNMHALLHSLSLVHRLHTCRSLVFRAAPAYAQTEVYIRAAAAEGGAAVPGDPDLGSLRGWAICRAALAQAPHRALALALAFRRAAAAAAGPAPPLEAPRRLAVVGAALSALPRLCWAVCAACEVRQHRLCGLKAGCVRGLARAHAAIARTGLQ